MSAELRLEAGHNKNTLTLNIGGFGRRIIFRSGGECVDPVDVHASSSGGVYAEGLFQPWDCEGEVTISKSLAQWILKVYQEKNFDLNTSAIHESYSSVEGTTLRRKFLNARIKKVASFSPDELGGDVTMKISFSLNDLDIVEVV